MVGTMIVAAAAGTTAAGVAASFALTAAAFAVNFAVSMIVTRVFGQDQQGPQDSGTREQVPPSNTNAIPVVYGDAYLGGTFVDAVLSTDQKTMYYVMAVSCVSPNGQFTFDTTDMYYGDRLITFDGTDQTKVVSLTDEAGNVDDKISGNLYISLYKSSASGTITSLNGASAPNVVMGGSDIDSALRWPSTGRQMNGLAFAIIKLNYNTDAGTTNLSPITFKASHYLNSTGVAKPGDVWYDYITNTAYGGAVDTAFVDTASVTAINSYADGLITYTPSGGGSATEARYRINGVIDAGQTVLSNLDKVMTCCDSWMAYNAAAGQWSIVINKSESAAYSFDDDNIIGEIRVSATDITQSINQVEAKFPNGESRDQPDFVNIATPTGLLYPNEPVNKYSVSYDLVNDSVRAQYLANRILEQAREDLIVSFSTTYYGIQVDAGSVVSVTNSDYGWSNKLFRVVKVNEASLPNGSLGAKLEMTEYSAAVYDDFDITQYTPVPNSDIPSPIYFSALSAPTVVGYPSASIPSFDVTIVSPAVGRITYGELYYTTSATPSASDWKFLTMAATTNAQPFPNSTSYTFASQVLPDGTYYFAFTVGNELGKSILSTKSSAFVWNPTGMTGATGLSNIQAYKVQSQSAAAPSGFPQTTSGTTVPSGWSSTLGTVSVGQVAWYTFGKYNSSTTTIDGIAPNTTYWASPIAASIFQDIRSDNWNGSNPPSLTPSNPATWGTAGYYIQQSTGYMYLNSIYARGAAKFNGTNTIGSDTFALVANESLNTSGGIVSYSASIFNGAMMGYGSGSAFGGYFQTTGSQAALACSTSGSGPALQVNGPMTITNNTLVTNLNADLLDGNHASAFLTTGGTAYAANRLNGSAGLNVLRFVQGTLSGSATATFPGNNKPGSNSTATWLQITVDATTLYIPVWT